MTHFYKKALVALSLLLVLAMTAAACVPAENPTDTETETETETETKFETETETETETESATESATETETETETEPEIIQDGYALLFDESLSKEAFYMTNDASMGLRISIAENYALNTITTDCVTKGDRIGSMKVNFYRWDTDYVTTVAAGPAYSHTVENFVSPSWDAGLMGGLHAWVTIDLPEGTIGEGEWLYLYEDGTGNVGLNRVKSRQFVKDSNDIVTILGSFENGEAPSKAERIPLAHVTYSRTDVTAETETAAPDGYTKLSNNKAHVIILSGQSNAAGASYMDRFRENSPELMAYYTAGFDNIYVYADCTEPTLTQRLTTNGFVEAKMGGMSSYQTTYGPEVGLADYLSRTYPGETFYIIKAAVAGSSLADHWGDNGVAYNFVDNHIGTALAELENMGLDPEIFAFLWLQGESDADSITLRTKDYITRFESVTDRLEAKYADYMAEGGMAIVDASICENTVWNYAAIINQLKEQYAALSQNRYFLDTNLPGIDTRDENGDPMHYDSDAMIKIGEMYGEAVGQILQNAGFSE